MGRRRGARAWGRTGRPDDTMSPAAFEHTCASFRAALISGAQRDDTDDLRAMLDDGYVSVPRDMTRAIRSAALGVALMRACERGCAGRRGGDAGPWSGTFTGQRAGRYAPARRRGARASGMRERALRRGGGPDGAEPRRQDANRDDASPAHARGDLRGGDAETERRDIHGGNIGPARWTRDEAGGAHA